MSSVLCVLAVSPRVQANAGERHLKRPVPGHVLTVLTPQQSVPGRVLPGDLRPSGGGSHAEQGCGCCWQSVRGSLTAGKIPVLFYPREHVSYRDICESGQVALCVFPAFGEQGGLVLEPASCPPVSWLTGFTACISLSPLDGFHFISVLQNGPCSLQM